jgi:hypothetical protein
MNLGKSVTSDIHTRGYITVVFVVLLSCFFSSFRMESMDNLRI